MDPMMKLKIKLKFNKRVKNQNLKLKHLGPNFKYQNSRVIFFLKKSN